MTTFFLANSVIAFTLDYQKFTLLSTNCLTLVFDSVFHFNFHREFTLCVCVCWIRSTSQPSTSHWWHFTFPTAEYCNDEQKLDICKKLLWLGCTCGYHTVMRCQNETKSDVNYHPELSEVGEHFQKLCCCRNEFNSSWKCRRSNRTRVWSEKLVQPVVANHLHHNDKVPSDLSHWNAHLYWLKEVARPSVAAAAVEVAVQGGKHACTGNDCSTLSLLFAD